MLLCGIVSLFVSGCASADEKRFVTGQGDVAHFIAHEAIRHGAHSAATNGVKPIVGSWRYFQDTNGVVVRLNSERFPEVYAALKQTFGPPTREPSETPDGTKIGWYAAKTLGVGIQFSCDREKSQVIVISPQDWRDVLKRAAELDDSKRR